jgi:hypothetical protein
MENCKLHPADHQPNRDSHQTLEMGRRDNLISKSILHAIFRDRKTSKKTVLGRIFAFFTVFQVHLARYRDELFKKLRDNVWEMDEDEYRESFRGQDRIGRLKSVGDLGYSGSVRIKMAFIVR